MRCAVTLEKIVRYGDKHPPVYMGYTNYPAYEWLVTPTHNTRVHTAAVSLPAGTYTVSATLSGDITCKVYTYVNRTAAGVFPASGEAELPYTFTLTEARSVAVDFAFAGWGDDVITLEDVTNAVISEGEGGDADVWETVVIRPDEMPDSDSIAQALNSKTSVTLRILPQFEAWGFAEKSITYVRVIDLDRTSDRVIFRGRVSAITDGMDDSGRIWQNVVCASALDFLEDTELIQENFVGALVPVGIITRGVVSDEIVADHNGDVDDFRKFAYSVTGNAYYMKGGMVYGTKYSALVTMLTDGYLRKYVNGIRRPGEYTMEFREDFSGDVNTLEIAERFGQTVDTAIMTGDNLRSIRVEKAVQDAVYTSVTVMSGVCSDGLRHYVGAKNDEMYSKYGSGRRLIVVRDDIKCTAAVFEDVWISGIHYPNHHTEAYETMMSALETAAKAEAAKLSEPPVKMTISAVDLAAMGYSGYEPFEVGNSHPVICPPLGLDGKLMRITQIKRRLSDGRIESLTVENGEGTVKSLNTLSAQLARLDELNRQLSDSAADQADIAQTIVNEQNGGLALSPLTQEEFDDIEEKDENTIYYVDDDGVISIYKGDTHISTGEGGGTIENACVLTSEQMTEWAPEHELVPVEFRGSANVYYSGTPAYVVIQGQRAYFGALNTATVTPDDIMSELTFSFTTGARQKMTAFIAQMDTEKIYLGIRLDDVSGTAAQLISVARHSAYWWITPGTTSVKFGFTISCLRLTDSGSGDELVPVYWINMYLFCNNALASYGGGDATQIISQTGTLFTNHYNIKFGSTAEEHYASALTRRTEPSYPTDEDDEEEEGGENNASS